MNKVHYFGPKGRGELSIKSLTRHYNPAPEVVNVKSQGVWVYWRSKRKGTRIRVYRVINEQGDSWAKEQKARSEFATMTKEQALEYCYRHEDKYKSELGKDGARQFDCLIAILESGTIEPRELPDYGMNYEAGSVTE